MHTNFVLALRHNQCHELHEGNSSEILCSSKSCIFEKRGQRHDVHEREVLKMYRVCESRVKIKLMYIIDERSLEIPNAHFIPPIRRAS